MQVQMESELSVPADALRWHLAMTKPASEDLAAQNLVRQGYGIYFPRVRQKLLRRGKWCERIVALFPRYVFVRLHSALQSLGPIRSTLGVAQVVRFGVEYLTVPNRVVDALKDREDASTGLHRLLESAWFKHGDPVRIAAGPLTGFEGIFESDNGRNRVTVLLNLLGRETRIQVNEGCVLPSVA